MRIQTIAECADCSDIYGFDDGLAVSDVEISSIVSKAAKKVKSTVKKVEAKGKNVVNKVADTARKDFNKGVKGVKKLAQEVIDKSKVIAYAPARNAFLLLVKENAGFLARNLSKVQERSPDKLKHMWHRMGGEISVLNRNINMGKKKKPLFGIGEPVTATTIAAAITAATPIIIASVKLIDQLPPKDRANFKKFAADSLQKYGAALNKNKNPNDQFNKLVEKYKQMQADKAAQNAGAGYQYTTPANSGSAYTGSRNTFADTTQTEQPEQTNTDQPETVNKITKDIPEKEKMLFGFPRKNVLLAGGLLALGGLAWYNSKH